MQMQDPKHRAEEDERQASGLRVRAARRPEAAPLIEEVFKTPLRSAPAFESMVEFTAREGKEIAERMRERSGSAPWAGMDIEQMRMFRDRAVAAWTARHGRRPTLHSPASAVAEFCWKHGSLPAHRIGRLWKFKLSEVDEWVRTEGAADEPTKGDR